MDAEWEEDWVEAFAQAASQGADCGTARAIAWAKVHSKKVESVPSDNPRRRLYIYPNKSSIAAADRGLIARRKAPKSKRGGLDAMQAKEEGVGSGVLRARDIVSGKRVNAYQVKAFFDRHQGSYLAALDKGLRAQESKAIQAWLLWGGDPLYSQVKREIKRDRKNNPATAAAVTKAPKGKKRRRLYAVPPLRKGRPSTWRKTKTGKHRARLGSLPDKWRSEWVRVYKRQYESIRKRSDLNDNQAKTVAAMSAWETIKKMGCRLPKSARPSPAKGAAAPPNKRSRDREKRQSWVCPEWETTEKARAKVVEEVRKESEGVARRERARRRKEEAAMKRADKARAKSKRDFDKTHEKIRKKVVEQQTAKEYSEAFKKSHGAHGLLPPEPKGKKKPAKKKSKRGKETRVPRNTKKYDKSKSYKVGDIINHPTYGIGLVRIAKGKTMEVKFSKRTDGKQIRNLRMGG